MDLGRRLGDEATSLAFSKGIDGYSTECTGMEATRGDDCRQVWLRGWSVLAGLGILDPVT